MILEALSQPDAALVKSIHCILDSRGPLLRKSLRRGPLPRQVKPHFILSVCGSGRVAIRVHVRPLRGRGLRPGCQPSMNLKSTGPETRHPCDSNNSSMARSRRRPSAADSLPGHGSNDPFEPPGEGLLVPHQPLVLLRLRGSHPRTSLILYTVRLNEVATIALVLWAGFIALLVMRRRDFA